ncbi:MAG: hypothetical protein HY350_03295, partial [Candidatus Omnitrophica bacterium]|nr:hypothetical protein [Candidatus Omnitrophota bacterium]
MRERKLGEAWTEWYENRNGYEPDADEPKEAFLVFSFLSLILLIAGSFFLLFLIGPRLYFIHPRLLWGVDVTIKIAAVLLALEFSGECGIALWK